MSTTTGDRSALGSGYLAGAVLAAALGNADELPVLEAMRTELDRSMEVLGAQDVPPYFLSYELTENRGVSVDASFGALTRSDPHHQRFLDVDLRVGSHDLDNTRPVRGGGSRLRSRSYDPTPVPVGDDPDAIRAVLWWTTDRYYKTAREQLTAVQTDVRVSVETEDKSDDFSEEQAFRSVETPRFVDVDVGAWERKVERYSAPFADHGEIYQATASFSANVETRWFVNSEGSEIRTSENVYRLFVYATTKAEDGMVLPLYKDYAALSPEGLPDDETVARDVARLIDTLLALRGARLVEPYTGPAILTGEASGVFFHEILGHRLEGHRQKRESEGQTFKKQLNQRLLPENFSVHFDPALTTYGGTDLVGTYRYDNQGIKGQRVTVIDKGILKDFLMARIPIDGFPKSNGHGRKQAGYRTVARQSNLVVEVTDPLTGEELDAALLAAVEKEGKPFGLRFEAIEGGFTTTGRFSPNAFNVSPLVVYRVYPDGREELVRGVDMIGTPLTTLSLIVAGDDRVAVFNGLCGAESGGVPVSAASPSILVSAVEVQKKDKSQDRPPLLPAPLPPVNRG